MNQEEKKTPESTSVASDLQQQGKFARSLLTGRLGYAVAIFAAALSIAFAGYRATARYATPSPTFDFSKSGMNDFHNGVYFPSKAFAQQINPYAKEVCETYPMSRSAPPYSPVVFMLYQPITWLDLPAADILFFALNTLALGLFAWCIVTTVRKIIGPNSSCLLNWFGDDILVSIWAFTAFMFSRPGHITLFTGYFTAQLVIGVFIALHYSRSKPWLAGVGMLLASGKPTYIIPLTILMLFRRDFKATVIGLILCAVFAAAGIGWLALNSDVSTVVDGIKQGQAAFDDDPTEIPVNTWTRLDAMGVVAKIAVIKPSGFQYLAGMIAMLIPIGFFIFKLRGRENVGDDSESFTATSVIACLALLVSIYHHSYDALLVLPIWLALLIGGRSVFKWLPGWQIHAVFVLLTVPIINYVATLRFRELFGIENQSAMWNAITSANGVSLLACMIVVIIAALKSDHQN